MRMDSATPLILHLLFSFLIGSIVAPINYRPPTPEHRYPSKMEEAFESTKNSYRYLMNFKDRMNSDPNRHHSDKYFAKKKSTIEQRLREIEQFERRMAGDYKKLAVIHDMKSELMSLGNLILRRKEAMKGQQRH